jgi:DNA-binding MarR family transcriptional regulator
MMRDHEPRKRAMTVPSVSARARSDRLANTLGALVTEISAQIQDGLAERCGLGPSDAAAIVTLARRSRSIEELSHILGLSHSATVRLVDRLEDAQLVRRTPGEDRRSVTLKLTAAGGRRADDLLAERTRVVSEILEPLRTPEREDLARIVERLLEELAGDWDAALHICRLCDLELCESQGACPTGIGAERH